MKITEYQNTEIINPRVKVYKIKPHGLAPCCEIDVRAIGVWFTDAQPGDKFEIEILEMTYEEYKALPEYMGP
jgi:hypothetical protein